MTKQLLKAVSVEEGGHLTIPRSWSPGVQLGVQPPPLDHMLPGDGITDYVQHSMLFPQIFLYLEIESKVARTSRNVTKVYPCLRWSLVNTSRSNIVSSREVDTSSVKGARSQA